MLFNKKKKIKKRFLEVVVDAVGTCAADYESDMEAALRQAIHDGTINDENPISDELAAEIREKYLSAVEQKVNSWYMSLDPPDMDFGLLVPPNSAKGRLRKAFIWAAEEMPEAANVPPMAGRVYNTLYYAEFDEPADPSDCVALNHWQNECMQQALNNVATRLEKEYS